MLAHNSRLRKLRRLLLLGAGALLVAPVREAARTDAHALSPAVMDADCVSTEAVEGVAGPAQVGEGRGGMGIQILVRRGTLSSHPSSPSAPLLGSTSPSTGVSGLWVPYDSPGAARRVNSCSWLPGARSELAARRLPLPALLATADGRAGAGAGGDAQGRRGELPTSSALSASASAGACFATAWKAAMRPGPSSDDDRLPLTAA